MVAKRKYGAVAWKSHKGPRRYGSYSYGKGKGKVSGQYQMSSSNRGYLRTGGYYGRFANGGEMKFHDVDLDDAVVASGGTITDTVNIIAQGSTESQRIGRKCAIKSINWRYTITLPEADAVADPISSDTVRVIMYIDKQANGAAAAVTDILESADYQSFNNLANTGRFRTICDNLHTINYLTLASDGAGVVSSSGVQRNYSMYKKCNLPLEFDNSFTDGRLTTIRSNNIGVLIISVNGIAGFFSKIRLRFSDS